MAPREQNIRPCIHKHGWSLRCIPPPPPGTVRSPFFVSHPKNGPLINRVKPSVRTIKVWPAEADFTLQERFLHTDWSTFASQATSDTLTEIDCYTSSVLLLCTGLHQFHHRQCYYSETDHHIPKSEAMDEQGAATNVLFLNELNDFYARFERDNKETATKLKLSADHSPMKLSSTDVCNALSRISAHKAAGPDNIPGRVLRACAEQLAGVFTDIFNLSLAQAAVPTCFKCTSIVPVPKHSNPTCLNDYRPVALTPIVMKCFERLVLAHLKDSLPTTFDSHQFAYRSNRSTEDAVSMALHSVLTHLDNKNTYARMLFVDFSSAFNTIIPSKLICKLLDLGINTSTCNWVMDFLTKRPQQVRSGSICSNTITLNTGVPQGCVLSPFLYSLFTSDCRPVNGSNSIIKFADDTTVIGLITNNDETAYREEIQHLATWCNNNKLLLNTSKTKELIVDFRKEARGTHDTTLLLQTPAGSIWLHLLQHITLNISVPQGCVLSPILYSLFTSYCRPVNGSNSIIKFADDTSVIGLITNNDKTAYRKEIQHLATWCNDNNLLLNTSKTMELIVDFRKETRGTHDTTHINGMAVERLQFQVSGIYISADLSWAINTSSLVKKAPQRLFFLRTLKKNHLSTDILVNFYRCAIESILTSRVTVWYGSCSVAERKALQRVVKTAQRITETPSPSMENIQKKRCLRRAHSILKDFSHPVHRLFSVLPSGRRFRCLRTRTSRLKNSFFHRAVSLLNSATH
ncbi:gastrula zinc finger protein XlCGF28.1-like [Silurus meridionalis]|nr:gastrula zinc finger protein XlCGF28.1-like [Silurus meridionalis]